MVGVESDPNLLSQTINPGLQVQTIIVIALTQVHTIITIILTQVYNIITIILTQVQVNATTHSVHHLHPSNPP